MNESTQSVLRGRENAEYCQQHRHRNIIFKMVRNKEISLFFSSPLFFLANQADHVPFS